MRRRFSDLRNKTACEPESVRRRYSWCASASKRICGRILTSAEDGAKPRYFVVAYYRQEELRLTGGLGLRSDG